MERKRLLIDSKSIRFSWQSLIQPLKQPVRLKQRALPQSHSNQLWVETEWNVYRNWKVTESAINETHLPFHPTNTKKERINISKKHGIETVKCTFPSPLGGFMAISISIRVSVRFVSRFSFDWRSSWFRLGIQCTCGGCSTVYLHDSIESNPPQTAQPAFMCVCVWV